MKKNRLLFLLHKLSDTKVYYVPKTKEYVFIIDENPDVKVVYRFNSELEQIGKGVVIIDEKPIETINLELFHIPMIKFIAALGYKEVMGRFLSPPDDDELLDYLIKQ